MSDPQLVQRIEAALGTVMEPELHRDLMSLNMVRDLRVDDGTVFMKVMLTTPACPLKDRIHKDIEQALIPLNGVERVEVSWDSNVTTTRGLPGRKDIPGVRNVVAVSAGKGGVGKTTVSVNVAIALSQAMSLGTILKPDQAVVWRGPMIGGALRQFLYDVEWGELDYLVIDLPPGTGDAQLTLAQSIPLTGSVIVTTPQDVSVADVSRGVQMFRQLKVPVLGVVENMSGYICPHCGERTEIFGTGGGHEVSERFDIAFLGQVPLDPRIRVGGGEGQPLMASMPDSPVAEVFRNVASHIAAEVSKENFRVGAVGPVMPSGPRIRLG